MRPSTSSFRSTSVCSSRGSAAACASPSRAAPVACSAFLRSSGHSRTHFDEDALADWAPDVAAFASNLHASAAYRAELARVGVRVGRPLDRGERRPMTARGDSVLRLEDERLLRGAGCFTADIRLENELRMFVVRSPHAAARIVSIETADAPLGSPARRCTCSRAAITRRMAGGTRRAATRDFLGPRRPTSMAASSSRRRTWCCRSTAFDTSVMRWRSRSRPRSMRPRDAADHVRVAYEPLPHVTSAVDAAARRSAGRLGRTGRQPVRRFRDR